MAATSSGSYRAPKNANAVIAKNATATVTQSPQIIPFYMLFKRGNRTLSPQPIASWLTRK